MYGVISLISFYFIKYAFISFSQISAIILYLRCRCRMTNQSVKNINCLVQQLEVDPLEVINWRSDPLEAVDLSFFILFFDFQLIETSGSCLCYVCIY
jgi:hypothetical protein